MRREDTIRLTHAYLAALSRRDVPALLDLFVADTPAYSDPCRTGVSSGSAAVREHLQALCDALQGAALTPLDILADHEAACARWVAELPAPRSHTLDAVTLLRTRAGKVEEARTYFDASLFFPGAGEGPELHAAQTPPPALPTPDVALPPGKPLDLRAEDSRGKTFDLRAQGGRLSCILCASRGVQDHAQLLAETLGEHLAGDERVLLVTLLDGTDVPRMLLPVARSAIATLRSHAVRQFQAAFKRHGKPLPPDVEDLIWFLPDYDGRLFAAVGVGLPLKSAAVAVVDAQGRLQGVFSGPGARPAHDAAALCQRLLPG
ncbi:MAG: nuclear transport factor 2 family protein [Myxococcota bacterium]